MPTTPRHRHAFSLIELLVVMGIIGVLAAVSLPRLQRLKDQGEMSTAMTRVMRGVMAARQAAILRGKTAYFRADENYVWVIVDTTGVLSDSIIITGRQKLSELHNVTLTAPSGVTTIDYDPRGVSTQTTKKVFHFKHRNNLYDSLCVSKLGNTIRDKCPT
jgi:prepilin-type N-terminal cleavage/methylation domain-containing protein